MLAKRFPYAIYYRVESPGDTVVYRVLDCRQNPLTLATALEKAR